MFFCNYTCLWGHHVALVHPCCLHELLFKAVPTKKKGKTSALLLGDAFCGRCLRFIIIIKMNHSKLEHSHDIPSTQTFFVGGTSTVFLRVVIHGLGILALDVLQCFSSSHQAIPFCSVQQFMKRKPELPWYLKVIHWWSSLLCTVVGGNISGFAVLICSCLYFRIRYSIISEWIT